MSHASSRSSRPSAIAGSADKLVRMPISKQRNKHIQQTLVEAAKLAPRYSHELALVYERERQRGNKNRATVAVARKMVAYMLAVERRKQDFVLTGKRSAPCRCVKNLPCSMSCQPVSSRYATSDCSQTATGARRSPFAGSVSAPPPRTSIHC